jgi:hypothetical protein
LPRQAREKHRKKYRKRRRFPFSAGVSYHSCRPKTIEYLTPPIITFNETLEWIKEMR